AVAGTERELPEDRLRFVREQELECGVRDELARRHGDERDDRVRERGFTAGGGDGQGGHARQLHVDGVRHEGALAVEVAVERGARAGGFTRNGVERALREAEPGDAGQQRIARPLGNTHHRLRQYTTSCLIVGGGGV